MKLAPPSPPSPLSPPPPPPSPPPRRRRRRRPGNHRPRRPAPTRWGATPSRGTMQTPPVGWRACTLQLATAQSPEQYARLLAFAGGTDVCGLRAEIPVMTLGRVLPPSGTTGPAMSFSSTSARLPLPCAALAAAPVAAGPTRERVGQRSGREAVGRRPSGVVQRAAVVQADGVRLLDSSPGCVATGLWSPSM